MVKGAGVGVKGNGKRGRSRKFVAFSRTELYNIYILLKRGGGRERRTLAHV